MALEEVLEGELVRFVEGDEHEAAGGFVEAVHGETGATDAPDDGQGVLLAALPGCRHGQQAGGFPDDDEARVPAEDDQVPAGLEAGGRGPDLDPLRVVDDAAGVGRRHAVQPDLAGPEGALGVPAAHAPVDEQVDHAHGGLTWCFAAMRSASGRT